MKKLATLILFVLAVLTGFSQPPNDECNTTEVLLNVDNYCSNDAGFTTVNASNDDVWFQFTAQAFDVSISVSGNLNGSGTLGGTLLSPIVELYSVCGSAEIVTSIVSANNITTLYKGGLTIGDTYYIRVSGANTGTFKLCVNNYNPIVKPGQDCATASFLCNKESFTQTDITGAGLNNTESAGTCLGGIEANSAWYKWMAANDGTLTFTITPTAANDDIDWVLYDLGITGNCINVDAANAIRCNAAHGVGCSPFFNKTGLDLASTDINEDIGCGPDKDGFVKFINMQKDHVYALLVNNFSNGNNGFSMNFGGTGEFVGPQAIIDLKVDQPCTVAQNYTFASQSINTSGNVLWDFGQDATPATSTSIGPINVAYSTLGIKTVVLQVFGAHGCSVIDTKSFSVGLTPARPVIMVNKPRFCLGQTIKLSTPDQPNTTYSWRGPNNFTAAAASADIPVNSFEVAGTYTLVISRGGCSSDDASVIIPPVLQNPTAAFRTDPTIPAKLAAPISIHFINNSQDADTYLWDFGDGNRSTEISPQYEYTRFGEFDVTLTAFKSTVCDASVTMGKFVIRADNTLFLPNTFTPNGDNINDEFVVTITNSKTYQIQIFNRYGILLFTSNDIFDNWKGMYHNDALPVGTYYYIVDTVGLNGTIIKKAGSVTIIR